jgi:hypothetical protein
MPSSKDETIAWVLWYIARIEDLTINILIHNGYLISGAKRKFFRIHITNNS